MLAKHSRNTTYGSVNEMNNYINLKCNKKRALNVTINFHISPYYFLGHNYSYNSS